MEALFWRLYAFGADPSGTVDAVFANDIAEHMAQLKEWPYQFVDRDDDLKSWLDMRGLTILRIEGSLRCELAKSPVPRTPGRVRDELTKVLQEYKPGVAFNVVHVDQRETQADLEIFYLSCYYAVSVNLLPQKQTGRREEGAEETSL